MTTINISSIVIYDGRPFGFTFEKKDEKYELKITHCKQEDEDYLQFNNFQIRDAALMEVKKIMKDTNSIQM